MSPALLAPVVFAALAGGAGAQEAGLVELGPEEGFVELRPEENLTWQTPTRRLQASTSKACRGKLDEMINHADWIFENNRYNRWCRLRMENKYSVCCQSLDFHTGLTYGCEDKCEANCEYRPMIQLCPKYGKACNVLRKPLDGLGNKMLRVLETFCVPEDCDNAPDREALMQWYNTRYLDIRSGVWNLYWTDAELQCPSPVWMILGWTVVSIVLLVGCIGCGWFLFIPPKKSGQTMVSQADMNADADVVEPMDDLGNRTGPFSGGN